MPPLRETLLTLIYRVLGFLSDAVDDILFPSSRKRLVPTCPNEIDDLTDDQLLDCSPLPLDHPARIPNLEGTVAQITPTIIVKFEMMGDPWSIEAETIRLVSDHTTIPVPRVRRVIKADEGTWGIVMDIIPGQPLDRVWSSLSFPKKLWVAFTLRRYIRQLRNRLQASSSTPPGPACPPYLGPAACHASSVFYDTGGPPPGPFQTRQDFWIYMDRLRRIHPVPEDRNEEDERCPFVLSHLDLARRNIILGDDGQLWLIDWAWSGYYPKWFEFVGMRRMRDKANYTLLNMLVPFVCGPSFREERTYFYNV